MYFQEEKFYPSVLKKLQLQIARDDQEVVLSINSPTTSTARVDQDVTLTVNSPTTSLARVDQDVVLTVNSPTTSKARVDQEVIFFIMGNVPKVQVTQSAYLGYRTKWRSTISTGWRRSF